jgi:hypothetical protein
MIYFVVMTVNALANGIGKLYTLLIQGDTFNFYAERNVSLSRHRQ